MIIKGIKSFNMSFFPMLASATIVVLIYTIMITLKGSLTPELRGIDVLMVFFALVSGVLASKTIVVNQPKGILLSLYFLVVLWVRLFFFISITVSLLLCFDRSKYFVANYLRIWLGTKVLHGEDYILLFGLIVLLIFGLSMLKIEAALKNIMVKQKIKNKLFMLVIGKKYFLLVSMATLVLGLGLQGLVGFSITAIPLVKPIIENPLAGYDWKMRLQVGPFYDYTRFVNQNTPPDAVFLEPPMIMPWPLIGNEGYTRYFIFPRELVKEDSGVANKKKITHIFIVGRKDGQWPTTKIEAKHLYYMPEKIEEKPIILEKDYDPQDQINDLWGIIELNK